MQTMACDWFYLCSDNIRSCTITNTNEYTHRVTYQTFEKGMQIRNRIYYICYTFAYQLCLLMLCLFLLYSKLRKAAQF